MNQPPIFVNGKPFFGRKEEQRDFRNDLNRALNPDPDEADDPNTFIMYLYGDGGMGKTTLLRRFRDIVKEAFSANFTVTYVDWERERERSTALQVERSRIPLTAVLDSFYNALLLSHPDWKKPLERYQVALEHREQVRSQAESLFQTPDERDPLAPLRGVSATFLGKFLRASAEGVGVAVGDEGENALTVLTEMGIQATEKEARRLVHQAEQRVRARLSRDELQMLLNPELTLAQQLGAALKQMSNPGGLRGKRPLLFFWDTYEIIDANDTWLREMMNAAGADTVWVLAGRNDLVRSREYDYGKKFFRGYQDVATRFRAFDMKQMTLGDVRDYFNAAVPEKPLDEPTANAIFQATRAIPLAVREAADLWKKGVTLSEIVADTGATKTGPQIVKVMTQRYHLHCVNLDDEYDLNALALANGDPDLLRALLEPIPPDPGWHLENRLRTLERAYASVHRDPARLHEDAATFFTEYLRAPDRRREFRTVALIDRAIANLESRLTKEESSLRLIEDRHADETWRDLALKLADFYFWKGETEGWQWVAPRYLESTVYSRAMRDGLLKGIALWKRYLSKQGQQRIEKMEGSEQGNFSFSYRVDPQIVSELRRWQEAGWLNGEGMEERRAIFTYWQAQVAYGSEKYEEALRRYESLRGLPEEGEQLKRRTAEALGELCNILVFPKGGRDAVANPLAVEAGRLGMNLDPSYVDILYPYAVSLIRMKQPADALELLHAYIQRGGNVTASNQNTVGAVYRDLKQYDEAIAAYNEAIRLDPAFAYPHNGLGHVYRDLKQYKEAIAAYYQALTLAPEEFEFWNNLGIAAALAKNYSEAIKAWGKVVEFSPTRADAYACLADNYRKAGDLEHYHHYITLARNLMQSMSAYGQACIESIAGNVDEALRLLEQALEDGSGNREWARQDPDFDTLRDDPRFRALVGLDDPAPS